MHELHRLSDEVLGRVERCAWYLHHVHDDFGAIDTETHVKVSTLLVDARADMERRGMPATEDTPGWARAELDDGTPVYLQQPDNDSAPP